MQIISLTGILIGSYLVFVFQDSNHGLGGLLLICLCAALQAFKITLENRLFFIDWSLEPETLLRTTCIWNSIFLGGLFLLSTLILGSIGDATGSNLKSLQLDWAKQLENPVMTLKLVFFLACSQAATYFGLKLTRNFNAVYTQSASMLCLPLTQ